MAHAPYSRKEDAHDRTRSARASEHTHQVLALTVAIGSEFEPHLEHSLAWKKNMVATVRRSNWYRPETEDCAEYPMTAAALPSIIADAAAVEKTADMEPLEVVVTGVLVQSVPGVVPPAL